MPTPPRSPARGELEPVLEYFATCARSYFAEVDERPALDPGAADAAAAFRTPLPAEGVGAEEALRELWSRGLPATAATSGPRYYHWVTGGTTPAAM